MLPPAARLECGLDAVRAVDHINCPVGIVNGERDTIVEAEAVAERVRARDGLVAAVGADLLRRAGREGRRPAGAAALLMPPVAGFGRPSAILTSRGSPTAPVRSPPRPWTPAGGFPTLTRHHRARPATRHRAPCPGTLTTVSARPPVRVLLNVPQHATCSDSWFRTCIDSIRTARFNIYYLDIMFAWSPKIQHG